MGRVSPGAGGCGLARERIRSDAGCRAKKRPVNQSPAARAVALRWSAMPWIVAEERSTMIVLAIPW